MLFRVERAGSRYFDDVTAPQTFGAEQLNERAAAAHALPRLARQVLNTAHADIAVDSNALSLHKVVIRSVWAEKLAEPSSGLVIGGFLPC